MYPMHSYKLLHPKAGQQFRAYLYVTFRNDKAHFVGINHACVTKGMTALPDPEWVARENQAVLIDLTEIKKNYESKLKDASWNK